jgi:hypothetical protein
LEAGCNSSASPNWFCTKTKHQYIWQAKMLGVDQRRGMIYIDKNVFLNDG